MRPIYASLVHPRKPGIALAGEGDRIMRKEICSIVLTCLAMAQAFPAQANNLGENGAWQFRTSADLANLASVLDLMQKRQSGSYAAPVTTTTIARQYNCTVAASAVGNSGTQTALANSPTVSGASVQAQGNASSSAMDGEGGGSQGTHQANTGGVAASLSGATSASISGNPSQALNSTQTNSGVQTASVTGSTGCSFGAVN